MPRRHATTATVRAISRLIARLRKSWMLHLGRQGQGYAKRGHQPIKDSGWGEEEGSLFPSDRALRKRGLPEAHNPSNSRRIFSRGRLEQRFDVGHTECARTGHRRLLSLDEVDVHRGVSCKRSHGIPPEGTTGKYPSYL